jgi:hypothetical protein
VFRRLLPLVLALCTLVPGDVLARFVEACRVPDGCCCREDDARAPADVVAQRPDCCAAPCSQDATTAPAIAPSREPLALEGEPTTLAVTPLLACASDPLAPPRARTRGPPHRVHAFVERWLI